MGKYRSLGTGFDRTFRNDLNANFDDIDTDFNLQGRRINDIIINNPQPSEIVDARLGFPILRNKLESIDSHIGVGVGVYAVGNGTDETTPIQNALNAGAGKTVVFPYGKSFKITSTLAIPDNTIIFAYGARIYNDVTHLKLLSIGNNVKIFGLELQGAGNTAYNASGIGIELNNVSNVLLEDCYVHDLGAYGVYAKFAKNVNISRSRLFNIGYTAIGGLSVENFHVSNRTYIKNVSPGTANNAYGVYFSRQSFTDLTAHPRSKDCSVTNCIVEDIPLWEALDTHGGQNISFSHNTIRNCKIGIAFVSATGDGGVELYGPQEGTAIGNHIYGNGTGYGVVVQAPAGDYAKNFIVEGNKLYRCGEQTNNVSGAIHFLYTKDLVVLGNTLRDCFVNGIHFYHHNYGFVIEGNTVVDTQDSTYTAPSCIASRSEYNEGIITGNSLRRENATLNTYVSERGINFSLTTNTDVIIGENLNNCTIKVLGGNGSHVKYSAYGNGLFRFVGAGSPESIVSAPVGSEYININGGAGTTYYIKQSGTGSAGWVGK